MKAQVKPLLYLCIGLFLTACAPPRSLPAGPTPIPTLIPATEPSGALGAPTEPVYTIQSYPARLPSASLGQSLYNAQCANCHGEDGNGVVPGARNFGDFDYMRGETPADFYAAVTEGRGDMPGFTDSMTSDERWDVVAYVWRFSTDPETLALGKHLYEVNCSACHGVDGTGEVLGAADLSDLRIVDNIAPRDFYLTLTQGRDSMPAFQGRLSQDERWAAIDYIRTFSYEPALSGESAASPPPTAIAVETTCDPSLLSQSNPFAWDEPTAIAAGQIIYDQACAVCHGQDGSGGLPGTIDFTADEASSALRTNSGEALCVVAEGENTMPGWKETLSVDQMWQVLTYIGSLGP